MEQAVNRQFDRMEAMLLVRTKVTDADGDITMDAESAELIVEDDGCD